MGKIVKFCSSCDESFAEKFGFCPTCGATLQAFEMNPLAAAPAEPEFVAEPAVETADVLEISEPAATEVFAAEEVAPVEDEVEAVVQEEIVAAPEEVFEIPAPTAPVFIQTKAVDADAVADHPMILTPLPDDDFGVTVIEEKNGSRNGLLLGTFVFMVFGMFSGLVYNIFSKDINLGSLDDGVFTAVILDDPAMLVENEEERPKDNKKAGGGGGGGGNEEDEPASQGARPPMSTQQLIKPSAHMERLTNPSIPIQATIQGPINETTKDPTQRYGLPTGNINTVSDGPGSGGGIGSGRNGGVGPGSGPGYGPGANGGLGGGTTGDIGPGDGPGGGGTRPPAARVGVTQGLKIISKPRAGYTDSARQNNVTGKVVLRITFLANGSIGSITPVSGLGYGLTEQAIAAARRIQFEPAKVNGVAQTTTKTFEYGFSIY
ncbi:MAG TPA: TonB family protein [Pyrinomonadaceae bacterium]|nr:TonB family protein [Pyrinomonadaceae bacterium]